MDRKRPSRLKKAKCEELVDSGPRQDAMESNSLTDCHFLVVFSSVCNFKDFVPKQ